MRMYSHINTYKGKLGTLFMQGLISENYVRHGSDYKVSDLQEKAIMKQHTNKWKKK